MKMYLYEVTFKVTKTNNNGTETRFKKSVYIPRFDEETGRHISPEQQIKRGFAALKEEGYYDLEFLGTKATALTFG